MDHAVMSRVQCESLAAVSVVETDGGVDMVTEGVWCLLCLLEQSSNRLRCAPPTVSSPVISPDTLIKMSQKLLLTWCLCRSCVLRSVSKWRAPRPLTWPRSRASTRTKEGCLAGSVWSAALPSYLTRPLIFYPHTDILILTSSASVAQETDSRRHPGP